MTMNIRPINDEKSYERAMQRLEEIFDAKLGTSEGDELDVLTTLVERYEARHWPIDLPDPVEAIKFRMEQLGYSQSDLAEVVGTKSRASEILNRKRQLSLEMIRRLHAELKIPTDVLIQAY